MNLQIVLNGELVFEYDRSQRVPGKRREFLQLMDSDMAMGIELNGVSIEAPALMQQAQYVGVNLAHALHSDNEALRNATCTWLALRVPELQQVLIEEHGEAFSLQLKLQGQ